MKSRNFPTLLKAAENILTNYKKKPKTTLTKLLATYVTLENPDERDEQTKLLYNVIAQLKHDIKHDNLDENHAYHILKGTLIFIDNTITNSYKITSSTNSGLSGLIKAVTDNPDAHTQFLSIASLYDFITHHHAISLTTDDVLKQIKEMADKLEQPFKEKITQLCIRLSTHKLKQKNIASLRSKYEAACKKVDGLLGWWHSIMGRDPERPKSILLLEALSDYLKTTNRSEEEYDKVIDGCISVILAGIENGYYFSSPLNSKLYELIQQDFGLANSSQHFETTETSLAAYNAEICDTAISEEKLDHWKGHGIEKAALEKAKKDITSLQLEIQVRKNGVHVSDNRKVDQLFNTLVDSISKAIANGCVVGVAYELTNLITASSAMNFFQLLTMTSPQVTLLTLSAIYAAQHLPISSMVGGLAAPMLKPVLTAPINATAGYMKPTLFQPAKKILTDDDFEIFLAHYYLSTPETKRHLDEAIDWNKLGSHSQRFNNENNHKKQRSLSVQS